MSYINETFYEEFWKYFEKVITVEQYRNVMFFIESDISSLARMYYFSDKTSRQICLRLLHQISEMFGVIVKLSHFSICAYAYIFDSALCVRVFKSSAPQGEYLIDEVVCRF